MNQSYQPIILIGAPRSGTKLVRNLIARHPSVDKVPYDVNFIWRIGNELQPHDELTPDSLTPESRQRIIRGISASSKGAPFLIEKTVSNCLRVPFVAAVFPEAKFIHLIRDGSDVVESIHRQWQAPPDWKYIMGKALSFPITQAFGYGLSYAADTVRKTISGGQVKRGSWGPRYMGIDEDVLSKDLLEVCARQWVLSVQGALEALDKIDADRSLVVRYEDFIRSPRDELEMIAKFAGIDPAFYVRDMNLDEVTQKNIGNGNRRLTAQQRQLLQWRLGGLLDILQYDPCRP